MNYKHNLITAGVVVLLSNVIFHDVGNNTLQMVQAVIEFLINSI